MSGTKQEIVHTHFPEIQAIIEGEHTEMPKNPTYLARHVQTAGDYFDKKNWSYTEAQEDKRSYKNQTTLLPAELQESAQYVASRQHQFATGQVSYADMLKEIEQEQYSAADYTGQRDNLDHRILIQLYNKLWGDQTTWFWLDNMFLSIPVSKLLLRMSFRDNVRSAQIVPRRAQYDTTLVKYDEIDFSLVKAVNSWDMPIEDPLMAMLSPITPLVQSNQFSLAYLREERALQALKQLNYHYRKDGTDAAAKFSRTTAPTDNGTQRIGNPSKLSSAGFHSENRVADELQDANNSFLQAYDQPITHGACSPRTATKIAANTWTEPNTIMNVEAYRTQGGVRPFPGLSGVTMVISLMVPENEIYFACRQQGALMLAEGPKTTRAWVDNSRFTEQSSTLDFYQYKCVQEDLSKIDRRFGYIVDLQTS